MEKKQKEFNFNLEAARTEAVSAASAAFDAEANAEDKEAARLDFDRRVILDRRRIVNRFFADERGRTVDRGEHFDSGEQWDWCR